MNAVDYDNAPAAARHVTPIHPTRTFRMLLKREFWENRGGFFWAPVVTGAITILFVLLGLVGASVLAQRASAAGKLEMNAIRIDGDVLGAGDALVLAGVVIASIVMTFVIFFYCLGALYDERRDRSVLFWKSLPVSDAQVVLSKTAWALVLAPLFALGIGVVIGLVLWALAAVTVLLNGFPDAMTVIFQGSNPLSLVAQLLAVMPVYMLWALPTVGWLMLCSAWARRVPFLWAVLVPILGCAMVSVSGGIFSTVAGVDFPHNGIWYVVVGRGLLSLIPGMWYVAGAADTNRLEHGPPSEVELLSSWQALGTLDLWIGVAAGAAMIFAAIRLRRWRDEG